MSELCGLVKLSSQFTWGKRYLPAEIISDLLLLHLKVKRESFPFYTIDCHAT